ncbi:MAG TPA: hemolysin III family protein [Bacilli bacterium]|nr:hemolysin III family protein [Bacilli bacterium]
MKLFRFREPVNTWTHLVTCLLAVAGLVILLVQAERIAAKLMMLVYGLSLVVLFLASSLFHAVNTSEEKELVWRKFDHMSIFLLIAGTYTPVFWFGLDGAWRVTMLATVWGIAAAGMVLKMLYMGLPRWLSTVLYVALGWIAIVPFYELVQQLSVGSIVLMLLGGVAYTIGAVIYGTKKLDFFPGKFGFHEVFHLWVSAGAILHFFMVEGLVV